MELSESLFKIIKVIIKTENEINLNSTKDSHSYKICPYNVLFDRIDICRCAIFSEYNYSVFL